MGSKIPMMATVLVAGWSLAACQKKDAGAVPGDTTAAADTMAPAPAPSATGAPAGVTAVVRDASGRELGTLTLADVAQGVTITGRLVGLPPGEHGIHLHAVGKCEAPFTSAGGHWNPLNHEHGTKNPKGPHEGDLLNLTVAADSSATVNATTPGGTLRGTNALLDADGAAVVVHAGPDDYRSNPAGNSGDRVACGVVTGS